MRGLLPILILAVLVAVIVMNSCATVPCRDESGNATPCKSEIDRTARFVGN